MTTKLEAELAISSISKHPKNPRHKATADDDMVASVRENGLIQPVVVAPAEPGQYVLIAGHRRLDASKKAKRKTVPAIIREDLTTEGQQIEAMIIENGHRLDLTPIEEAEGYAQLELLGYKAAGIAVAVGRDVKTVRTRLKLLKLSATTRKKVHAGQLTIEDASALVEFADDPDATKRLERAASSNDSWSWKSTLRTERSRRDANRRIAVDVAKLLDAGAEQVDPKGKSSWQLWDHDLGPTPLSRTHSEDWGQHKGCLGFVHFPGGEYSSPTLDICCTKPSNHADKLDEAEREMIAAAEKEAAERVEREAAALVSADLRVATLLDLVDNTGSALPPGMRDVLRQLLPLAVADLSNAQAIGSYQRAMGVLEVDRWEWVPNYDRARRPAELVKLRQHQAEISGYSDANLCRALVAYLTARHEENLVNSYRRDPDQAVTYLELLAEAGHDFGPIDTELRDELTATQPAEAS